MSDTLIIKSKSMASLQKKERERERKNSAKTDKFDGFLHKSGFPLYAPFLEHNCWKKHEYIQIENTEYKYM